MIRQPPDRQNAVRPWVVLLGMLIVLALIGMTQALSIRRDAAEVGGNAPPPAPTYLLFFFVLLAAPLIGRWRRRLGLSRAELLLIYCMALVTGPISHPYAIGFLLPHTVTPYYLVDHEPSWRVLLPVIPWWLGPSDLKVVHGFFRGTGGPVPWEAWIPAAAAWCSLLVVLFFVMLCVNTLISRQWIDYERLPFPLTAIPLELTDSRGGLGHLLRQRPFYLGLAVPLVFRLMGSLHKYAPGIPAVQLQGVYLIQDPAVLPHPWNGLGAIEIDVIFWLLGVVYLLPTEIAFSGWLFWLVCRMENTFAVWRGISGEAPDVYTNGFPALFAQGAGAALALTAITLYSARRQLVRALRMAFSGEDLGDTFLSYRTAVLGLLGGIAFILGWCVCAGMRLWVAALLFGLMLAYYFIFARIRAETGLGMGVILWPKMLDEMMLTFVGARNLSLQELTMISVLRWLYFGSATGAVMGTQLEAFKIASAGALPRRQVGRTLALATSIAVPAAFAWTLKTYYTSGFDHLPIGDRDSSMVGSQVYWSYQNVIYAHSAPTGIQWDGVMAIAAGAVIAALLAWLRMRFLWFPLHPVGYLAANSWGMHINWAMFFLGWLIKLVVTRYGGLKIYRRWLPFFLGLIVGDMVFEGIWGLVTYTSGVKTL